MVGEGWAFHDLMAMSARDFMFWFNAQQSRNKSVAEAQRKAQARK